MKRTFLKIAFAVNLFIGVLLFSGCAGGNLPPAVCQYGEYVCETASFICQSVPNIPPQVCTYLDLACLNLSALCEYQEGTPEHTEALKSMEVINSNMKKYLLEKTVPENSEDQE